MSNPFAQFEVIEKRRESSEITSFILKPVTGDACISCQLGQHIVLRIPNDKKPALRSYSISGDPGRTDEYRITVKRKADLSESGEAKDGLGSCWLHDEVKPGEILDVSHPRGTFILDEASSRPIVLLSCGVGLTPLVSMLHRLETCSNQVFFIHACKNGETHALKSEVDEIAKASGGRIKTHYVYRRPTGVDEAAAQFDSCEVIDKCHLQSLLPLDDYDVYLCGPTPFMTQMHALFLEMGVRKEQIRYEFFGDPTTLDETTSAPTRAEPAPNAPLITFSRSNQSSYWSDTAETLLEFAEDMGLTPDFSCRSGVCGSCACGLKGGKVTYLEEPLDPVPDGQVLLCCARPDGPVDLDL